MPFIRITPAEDRAAGRGVGAPAVLPRSQRAAVKRKFKQWVPLRSSWISAVRFNIERGQAVGTMDMRTRDGREYRGFPGTTRNMFHGLMKVRSAGKWWWRYYPPRHVSTSSQPGSRPTAFGLQYHGGKIKGQRRI